jgi:hypothetical protein
MTTMNNIPDDILVDSILPYLQPEEVFALQSTDKHLRKSIRRLHGDTRFCQNSNL